MLLLIGGARSGKSGLGVAVARASGLPVHVVVTARADDDEMRDRIAAHRRGRPVDWHVVAAPTDLEGALDGPADTDTVLLDCLSLWVSNLMADAVGEAEVLQRAERAGQRLAARTAPTIVVTNEVGTGLVPMHPVGRTYRDLLGRVNATFSRLADRAWLVVAGRVLPLDAVENPVDLLP